MKTEDRRIEGKTFEEYYKGFDEGLKIGAEKVGYNIYNRLMDEGILQEKGLYIDYNRLDEVFKGCKVPSTRQIIMDKQKKEGKEKKDELPKKKEVLKIVMYDDDTLFIQRRGEEMKRLTDIKFEASAGGDDYRKLEYSVVEYFRGGEIIN